MPDRPHHNRVLNPCAIAGRCGASDEKARAVLQSQVDSLRGVVARQDTLLRQVANLSGIPITR